MEYFNLLCSIEKTYTRDSSKFNYEAYASEFQERLIRQGLDVDTHCLETCLIIHYQDFTFKDYSQNSRIQNFG